jgi:hypothetical protein
MIVSHSKRFIFIKTRKTAGSTLQKAFAEACAPGDILISSSPLLPAWASEPAELDSREVHAGKDWISERYPREWGEYTKISVERHPLDKIVSLYWWRVRGRKQPVPFREWFDSTPDHFFSCFDLYGDKAGRIVVDQVILFEDLQAGYEQACRALKLESVPLGQEKSGFRPNSDSTDKYFTASMLTRVEDIFQREISAFGYRLHSKR